MFSPNKTVISIDLKGMIASGSRAPLNMDNLNGLFSKVMKIKFDALSIVINSPGGSPVQSSLIAQKIREISDKKKVKCYCFVEDVAASGGYWLACAADELYADVNSIVGSIGVISGGFGFTDLIKKIGVERRIFTAGENKSFLDPFLKVNRIIFKSNNKLFFSMYSKSNLTFFLIDIINKKLDSKFELNDYLIYCLISIQPLLYFEVFQHYIGKF